MEQDDHKQPLLLDSAETEKLASLRPGTRSFSSFVADEDDIPSDQRSGRIHERALGGIEEALMPGGAGNLLLNLPVLSWRRHASLRRPRHYVSTLAAVSVENSVIAGFSLGMIFEEEKKWCWSKDGEKENSPGNVFTLDYEESSLQYSESAGHDFGGSTPSSSPPSTPYSSGSSSPSSRDSSSSSHSSSSNSNHNSSGHSSSSSINHNYRSLQEIYDNCFGQKISNLN